MKTNNYIYLCLLACLVSCSNGMTKKEVLQYFYEKKNITNNSYYIGKDYGTYGEARVIEISNDGGFYMVVCEQIEDLYFTYPQKSHNIDVLFEGEFYTLTQAYNNDILNYNQLKNINKKHKRYIKKLNIDGQGAIVNFE